MGGRRPDLVRTYVPRDRAKWNVTFQQAVSPPLPLLPPLPLPPPLLRALIGLPWIGTDKAKVSTGTQPVTYQDGNWERPWHSLQMP